MSLNIIIRGFIYKSKWSPISSSKDKYPCYTQDFRKIILPYQILFFNLSKKYKLKITFTSYNSTPEFMKQIIKDNNWGLHLISEKDSYQFSSCCSYLKKMKNNDITLILRSDLILRANLITLLSNFNYQNCKELIFLSREPNGKLNDILFIVPSKFRDLLVDNLKKSNDGHSITNIPYHCLVSTKWCVAKKNDYYKIYRGTL